MDIAIKVKNYESYLIDILDKRYGDNTVTRSSHPGLFYVSEIIASHAESIKKETWRSLKVRDLQDAVDAYVENPYAICNEVNHLTVSEYSFNILESIMADVFECKSGHIRKSFIIKMILKYYFFVGIDELCVEYKKDNNISLEEFSRLDVEKKLCIIYELLLKTLK